MTRRGMSFFSSIRFRLTAWYTLLLAVIIVAFAITLSSLASRELRKGVDNRLRETAERIIPGVTVQLNMSDRSLVDISMPPLNQVANPGQVAQIIDVNGQVIKQTGGDTSGELPYVDPIELSGGASFRTADIDGHAVRAVTVPMITEQTRELVGAIVVAESLAPVERTVNLLRRLLWFASPIGLLVAAAGGWLLAGRALRPIDRMIDTAASVASESGGTRSLSTRINVPNTNDEVARLARTFNQMLDRLETAFVRQRRFIADASHELRTPLTAIRGNIDVMMRQSTLETPDTADLADALHDLQRESARMSRLIEDLLNLARTDSTPDHASRLQPISLDQVVEDAMKTASSLTTGQNLDLIPTPPVTIVADRDRITELLLILVENAIRHTPSDGYIRVSLESDGYEARLSVRDTGEGIAPEHLPHVFDRFFRADAARDRSSGGTGLGLAIAQAIARLHGGEVSVQSRLGDGSTFTVRLPLRPRPPARQLAATTGSAREV